MMVYNRQIFVVIPTYNAEKTIKKIIIDLRILFPDINIIVVNDNSEDKTKEITEKLSVVLLNHLINLGQGAALQTGDELALKMGADIVVHFDADGQHQVNQLNQLIEPIINGEADIVFGSRFLNKKDNNMPWTKKYFILPMAKIVNLIFTGIYLTDAHNGYRAMNKKALEKIIITQNRMAHATEILQLVKENNLKYKEVSVIVNYHEYGQNLFGGIKIIRDLIIKSLIK